MGNATEKFKAIYEKLEDMKKTLRKTGETATKEALKEFFDTYPQVESIRWRQYTPYFNDGEECTFSVNEPEVKLKGIADGGDYDDGYHSAYSLEYFISEENKEEYRKLNKAGEWNKANSLRTWFPGASKQLQDDLNALYSLLDQADDAMRAAFGDHAEVTATRESIEVEAYEHE